MTSTDLDDLPRELPQSSKTLTAQCLCKSVHFTITVPSSSLPLPVHLCHCPICRYTHGTLCIFHAPLPAGIEPQFVSPSSLANLTGYTHDQGALSERLFCSTCGCHVGDRDLEPNGETGKPEWRVATSIFDQHGEDTFQIRSHCFTNSALAGGLYDFLPKLGDRAMHVWNPDPQDKSWPPALTEKDRPKQEFDAAGNERLRAQCHCGGVSFTIPRPTVPEAAGDEFVQKFISPVEKDKWSACLDVCDDCRLVDGTHVVAWTFVPFALLEPRVPRDLRLGTSKVYESSEDVRRSFCGVCGATVFFDCDERRPAGEASHVVDVAVGILRAPEGVLAERWLTWRAGKVSWLESGKRFDPVFATSLARGLDEWGKQKYGKSLDFEIGP